MRKKLKTTLLSTATLFLISVSSLLLLNINKKNVNLELNKNFLTKEFESYFKNDFNFEIGEYKEKINKFDVSETNNTSSNFNSNTMDQIQELNVLKNRVNTKYLDYVTLDFQHKYGILDARTEYEGKVSDKTSISSEINSFSKTNLNLNTDIKINNKEIMTQNIDYPFSPRQILGTINSKTDGFKTIVNFEKAANLPLNGSEYKISGSNVVDQNGNFSVVNPSDITISITQSNVGTVENKEKTELNNYQMIINKKITGRVEISLNSNSNHWDMKESFDVENLSPNIINSSCFYNKKTGEWKINIVGTNLKNSANDYIIKINNFNFIQNFSVLGHQQSIHITFENKVDDVELNNLTFNIIAKGQWKSFADKPQILETWSDQKSIFPETNSIVVERKTSTKKDNNNNDSQENPAGQGQIKVSTNIENFSVINNQSESRKDLSIKLSQKVNYGIKNNIYDWARYSGTTRANIFVKNSARAKYPKLDALFKFLTETIAKKAQYDNEFYFGKQEMEELIKNGSTINDLLFASNTKKIQILQSFYKKVFTNVFNAKSNDTLYKIGPRNESADDLFIFKPNSWNVEIEINKNSCYLVFKYIYFDGTEKVFKEPIRTKIFLNNNNKDPDHYKKWDLNFIKKNNELNVANTINSDLQYADDFYNLFNNIEGSTKLYNSVVDYKDEKIKDNNLKLIETLFNKKEFYESISRLNEVNLINKDRMIYFTSTDENGKLYNSWSDLAKGKMKFNIVIGKDINNFFLDDHKLKELIYTYEMTGFKTQYDIYYNSNANKESYINVQGKDNVKLNTIDIEWVLNNLIVYDNQSGNAKNQIRISPISNQSNNKILATNLLKEDFIKLVLKNKNNVVISDRDDKTGTFKITLKKDIFLGDDPSSRKLSTLTSQNNTTFNLLTNNEKKDLVFKINGFQKYYDVQYNKNNKLDAKKLNVNTSINEIENDIKINKDSYLEKLISFDWYDNPHPNFIYKLIKTRLRKEEFLEKINSEIIINSLKSKNGIDEFNGIFYGDFIFSGTQEQIKNALNNNITPANPSSFEKVISTKIGFSLNNLLRNIKFYTTNEYLINNRQNQDRNSYKIDWFNKITAKELSTTKLFFEKLIKFNLISFDQNNNLENSNTFINTNALNFRDLLKAIELGIFAFKNVNVNNAEGILDFDLVINSQGGKVTTNNNTNQSNAILKIRLVSLQKDDSQGIDNNFEYKKVKLNKFNEINNSLYKFAYEVNVKDVLNLFKFKDSIDNKFYLYYLDIIKQEFINKLKNNNQFINGIKISTENKKETNLKIAFLLSEKIMDLNSSQTLDIFAIEITNFEGIANTDWKIQNNNEYNIRKNNNNKTMSIDDFDENFIYSNFILFEDNKINNEILNNNYISEKQFKKQLNPQIIIKKQNNKAYVTILTSNERKMINSNVSLTTRNKEYSSINFVVYGFANSKTIWEKYGLSIIVPVINGLFTILTLGTLIIIRKKKNKIKK